MHIVVKWGASGLSAELPLNSGICENGSQECEPRLIGGSAGLSASAPLTSGPNLLLPSHTRDVLVTPPLPSSKKTDFSPLKVFFGDPMGFSAILGITAGDLHSLDRTADEDPMRNSSNTSGDWIRPSIKTCQLIPTTASLTPDELDIEEFWKTIPLAITDRITPAIRSSMLKSNDVEKWTDLTRLLETLCEFGSCMGKSDDKVCLDYSSQVPNVRSGKTIESTSSSAPPRDFR